MANFEKLKIGALISGAFAALAALILLMGGTSLLRVTSVSHDFETVMNDRYPKIASLQIISNNLQATARGQRDLLLLTDSDDVKKELDNIKARQAENSQRLDQLQSQITSESGKAALAQVTAARAEYLPISERFLSTVSEKPGNGQDSPAVRIGIGTEQVHQCPARPGEVAGATDAGLPQNSRRRHLQHSQYGVGDRRSGPAGRGVFCDRADPACYRTARTLRERHCVPSPPVIWPVRFDTAGQGETGVLLRTLQDMQTSLAGVVAQVRQGSEGVATASVEISQGNSDLSSRTESQASALEETAASMEELAATVRQNADSAHQANQLARNASTVAVQGGRSGQPGGEHHEGH